MQAGCEMYPYMHGVRRGGRQRRDGPRAPASQVRAQLGAYGVITRAADLTVSHMQRVASPKITLSAVE